MLFQGQMKLGGYPGRLLSMCCKLSYILHELQTGLLIELYMNHVTNQAINQAMIKLQVCEPSFGTLN